MNPVMAFAVGLLIPVAVESAHMVATGRRHERLTPRDTVVLYAGGLLILVAMLWEAR